MKKTKLCLTAIILVLLSLLALCLSGCANEGAYVGEYQSVWVDFQNKERTVSFSLSVKEDGTFVLSRTGGETMSGSYKTITEGGATKLLCLVSEGYEWYGAYPVWEPYFTLSFSDDGTLMATSPFTDKTKATPFGWVDGSVSVTMILFEKA